MKRTLIPISAFAVLGLIGTLFFLQRDQAPTVNYQVDYETLEAANEGREEAVRAYKEFMFNLRKNPATGTLEPEDVLTAMRQVREARQNASTSRSVGLEWEHLGPSNIGGRTRAIAIDPNNPSRLYAGSVSGGLFLTDNGGSSWYPHPQNPQLESTLLSSIVIAANGDIYFGTGEHHTGFYTGAGSFTHMFTGTGIYKSTDGGVTFSLLPSTDPVPGSIGSGTGSDWSYVNRIAAHPTDPNLLFSANQRGLYYTTDGGSTWNQANDGGINLSSTTDDVMFDANGIAHVIYRGRYLRSVDATSPWNLTEPSTDLPSSGSVERGTVVVAPSDPSRVYIYFSRSGAEDLLGIFRSTNGGDNFTQIAGAASDLFNPPGGQGGYNLCIAVNPANPDLIYVGGQLDAWAWRATTGAWDQIAVAFGSELFNRYVHADHHWFAFHPTNPDILYFGTDGGITRTNNARVQFPEWTTINKGYSTFQANGIAAGLFGETMAGSQDNGSYYVDFSGNSLSEGRSVLGGDGGEAEISKIKPLFIFGSFFDFTNGGGSLQRSVNGGNTFATMFDFFIDADQNGVADNGAAFVEADLLWEDYDRYATFKDVLEPDGMVEYPAGSGTMVGVGDVVTYEGETFELSEESLERGRFFYGTQNGLWMTPEVLKNSTDGPPTWFKISGSIGVGNVTSIDVTADGDVCFIGTGSGAVWRISNLNQADYTYVDWSGNGELEANEWSIDTAGIVVENIGNFGNDVTGVAVDYNDPNHVVISNAGFGDPTNVFESNNALSASPTFSSISSSLPSIPVFDVMIDYYNSDHIFAATEFGVWSYDGSGWAQETGLVGNVPTFEIRQEIMRENECRPTYIGCHGRGYFRAINNVPEALGCDFRLGGPSTGNDPIQEDLIAKLDLMPNPANSNTRMAYTLERSSKVTVTIYDLTGRVVRTVMNGNPMPAGSHNLQIGTAQLPNGRYLVVLDAEGVRKSAKLVVAH
jgi:photosystem II stability/assembly factor-like uncharacterized protein